MPTRCDAVGQPRNGKVGQAAQGAAPSQRADLRLLALQHATFAAATSNGRSTSTPAVRVARTQAACVKASGSILRICSFDQMRRPSRAGASNLPDRDAKLPGLVSQIVLDAVAREYHNADREHVEHRVVALERR